MARKDFTAATSKLAQAIEGTSDRSKLHLRSVQAQIEAIARGDVETALAQADDQVTLDIFAPPEFQWIRHARGIDELRAALLHNFATVEEQRPEVTNVHTEAESVVLFGRELGRIAATGQTYEMEFVERFTFRNARLISIRIVAAHVTGR